VASVPPIPVAVIVYWNWEPTSWVQVVLGQLSLMSAGESERLGCAKTDATGASPITANVESKRMGRIIIVLSLLCNVFSRLLSALGYGTSDIRVSGIVMTLYIKRPLRIFKDFPENPESHTIYRG